MSNINYINLKIIKGKYTMNDVFKKKAEIWNERLRNCIKNKYSTQTAFANELNNLRGDTENEITQKTISRWVSVGSIDSKSKKTIGFPKYENMILIANALDVCVGYLTGETDMTTFDEEQVCDYLHLNSHSIQSILRITGTHRRSLSWGYESTAQEYRSIVDNLLATASIFDLVKDIHSLNHQVASRRDKEKNIEQKLGPILYNKAWEIYNSSISCEHDSEFIESNPELCSATQLIESIVSDEHKLSDNVQFGYYNLTRKFEMLLNEYLCTVYDYHSPNTIKLVPTTRTYYDMKSKSHKL